MMPNLQTAIDEIEVRAADFPRDFEATQSCEEPSPARTPTVNDAAETVTFSESGVNRIEPQWRSIVTEPTDPYQAAAHKVLKQLGNHTETSLLLLSDTPSPIGRLRDLWGHAFAELIDEPVLMIELVPASPSESNPVSAADDDFPMITQSEHPGLCTLTIAWYALKDRKADHWWTESWEHFGMILLDASGLDLATIESILPRCTHVVFLIEYENTSLNWAKQIGKLVAANRTRSVGCIATASSLAACARLTDMEVDSRTKPQ